VSNLSLILTYWSWSQIQVSGLERDKNIVQDIKSMVLLLYPFKPLLKYLS